ncbi:MULTISPECIES: sugar ABC transporter permease [Paenibacillus]|jgi:arabinogalactan oligomer/maltooligosaccharide transport system permease protein|uniref:Carbohydrate ABC transporter membrane protein 2, CUT1 family n=1 Tax=Paenibacillus barengoltzii J12 TaxID=935846 RepID=A0ABY1M3K2_9BACL|nr:sugar ABC transporter permease [Paenibacillus barengoltzii]SMF65096.1 carbohydrate ABC transporter membrane protein 2, CUT1 family [Paenibacillus barengoltzii J12]
MSRRMKSRLEVTAIYLVIGLMTIVICYPLAWAIGLSFNAGTSLYSSSIIPKEPTLEHYRWLFTSPESNYLIWYKNTLYVSTISSLLSILFTSMTAYALSRFEFVGRKSGMYVFLLLQMFPVMMAMVALYIFLNLIGLLDTLIGLIMIYVGGQIPFNAWLVKGYLDTISRELDDAAKIDGAGPIRVFIKILLPLITPILAIVALTNFMLPIFDFILPSIILHDKSKYTLAVGLYHFVTEKYSSNFTVFTAGAILIAVPIAGIYLFLQKYFISGLAAGGTKG